jgi:tryptophan 2,3-dioxygenase
MALVCFVLLLILVAMNERSRTASGEAAACGGVGATVESLPAMSLTYSSYLKIEELLGLQQRLSHGPRGPEHDEMLFIVIHQVYELWFKQMLHEADELKRRLEARDHPGVCATLKRMLTILKTLVAQIDVLETMSPISFNSFRGRLESASGFQSAQFREFEFVLGHKNRRMVEHHRENAPAMKRLERRFAEPTVFDSFLRYLQASGRPVPDTLLRRDVTQPLAESLELQKVLIDIYRTDADTRQVCELLVDLDEGIQEWRYRHVKMVERTIGFKTGTGGSAGAEYLRSTLFRALFPDLWAIRSAL